MKYKAINILLPAFTCLFLFIAAGYTACTKPEEKKDPCKDVICKSNGICVDGLCKCLRGVYGDTCELRWQTKFEGDWYVFDSSIDGYKSYIVSIKPSETEPTVIVFDSFWKYKVNGIIAELSGERDFTFKAEQNVYPGYHENYILKKGDAKIDSAQKISGSFVISHPGDDDKEHFFTMKK